MLTPRIAGEVRLASYFDVVLKSAISLWGAAESFSYWTRMKRRVSLGLADRLTANRFLCWGVCLSASTAAFLAVLGAMSGVYSMDGLSLPLSACGLVSSFGLWFAFLPPRFYREWIQPSALPE